MLLEQPATCLDQTADVAQVQIGQALFNAPDLLGGQAARASLSCASCHSNGRRNPAFFLGGISDVPGSADVSSSFFSRARADGQFNPKPIPDLALPGKIDRNPASHALEKFIRGLIVEEFSGPEPSPSQLAGLASYVRALRACPGRTSERRNLNTDLTLLHTSIAGAIGLLDQHDVAGASVLVKSARFRLGLIDERMTGGKLHRALLNASRKLGQLPPQGAALQAWQTAFDRTVTPQLERNVSHSLYAPAVVDRWLAAKR